MATTLIIGNDKAKRSFTFPPVRASRLRVTVTGAREHFSRIAEVEAYAPR